MEHGRGGNNLEMGGLWSFKMSQISFMDWTSLKTCTWCRNVILTAAAEICLFCLCFVLKITPKPSSPPPLESGMQSPVSVRTRAVLDYLVLSLQEIAGAAPRPMGSVSPQKKKWGESGCTDSIASEATQPCKQTRSSCAVLTPRPSVLYKSRAGTSPSQLLTPAVACHPTATMSPVDVLSWLMSWDQACFDSPQLSGNGTSDLVLLQTGAWASPLGDQSPYSLLSLLTQWRPCLVMSLKTLTFARRFVFTSPKDQAPLLLSAQRGRKWGATPHPPGLLPWWLSRHRM